MTRSETPSNRSRDLSSSPRASGDHPKNVNVRSRRQILAAAVEENLANLQGRKPGMAQRLRDAASRRRAVKLSLYFAPLAMVATLALIWYLAPEVLGIRPPDQTAVFPERAEKPSLWTRLIRPVDPVTLGQNARPMSSSVFPVAIRTIVLDPGHGGRDNGTESSFGLLEKNLALDVALRLKGVIAERSSLDVLMTRDTDEYLDLVERADFANTESADLFVSIHLNWIPARQIRGVETYYLGPTDDPFVEALASLENQGSGYSMADVRRLLDGIYLDLKQGHSRRFAEHVQGSLFHALRTSSPDLRNRGVKSAPFLVLVETEMPAILAEVSCLSNKTEAKLLEEPGYRQSIAEALFQGIEGYGSSLRTTTEQGS